jgi:glycosyltransferase involved in cell wall biosynthesis
MKILRIAQNLFPEVPGGGAYHAHAMSRDQAAMGHDVTVLTVTNDEKPPRREQRAGYTVVRRRPTATLLGNDLSAGLVLYLQRASRFDIVHAHSHLYFSTNVAALRRTISDTPLAITNHGLYSQSAPEWVFHRYLQTLGRWTFNSADTVFCYTDKDRNRLREYGVQTNISVVANGVDTDRFTPDGLNSDRIDHDGPVVLFVGRLVEGKHPKDAVDAVGQLPDRLNAKLYVVGGGPLQAEVQRHAKTSGVTNIEFLGQVPYDAMPAIFRTGDVLLLPSRAEGLPRTILEGFASGVPAVTSRLQQTAHIVEKAGKTVEIGDIAGYAQALEAVLADSQRLGASGRQLVIEEFRWQDTVEKTTAQLESTCL